MSTGKMVVVDADIARGAARADKASEDRECSLVALLKLRWLMAIKDANHKLVFTPQLKEEWRKHQNATARSWLADIVSDRRVQQVSSIDQQWILALIRQHDFSPKQQGNAEKDAHLVVAACDHGDKRLISSDGRAKKLFTRLVEEDMRLAQFYWVGPSKIPPSEKVLPSTTPPDAVECWLREGAEDKPEWTLGAMAEAKELAESGAHVASVKPKLSRVL